MYKMQQQFNYIFTRRHAPECLVVSDARTQTSEGNAATKCTSCIINKIWRNECYKVYQRNAEVTAQRLAKNSWANIVTSHNTSRMATQSWQKLVESPCTAHWMSPTAPTQTSQNKSQNGVCIAIYLKIKQLAVWWHSAVRHLEATASLAS